MQIGNVNSLQPTNYSMVRKPHAIFVWVFFYEPKKSHLLYQTSLDYGNKRKQDRIEHEIALDLHVIIYEASSL